MKNNTNEKSLLIINEESLFYRIKKFFLVLFRRKEVVENKPQITNIEKKDSNFDNNQKNAFLESIKNIKNEETELLELQKKFDDRIIETKDLSKEQIKALIDLYKKQINELSYSNVKRKERLLEYKKKMQTDN